MNHWTVVWEEAAEIKLGNIWLGTGHNPNVTQASYEIDKALKEDPYRKGSPLAEGLWVIERPPLRAVFTISEADRLVRVLSLSVVRL